jgi:uncharacterized phage protein (TIGR02218 family)
MRSASLAMQAKLAGSSTRLCKLLRLERKDGTIHTFTDHDLDLVYDLEGFGDETYEAGTGVLISDITARVGLDPDNFEVTGPLTDDISLAGVLGGLFNGARVWLCEVDWSDLADGELPLFGGEVADARVRGSEYVFDVRDWKERLQETVGRSMLNTCDAHHTLPVDPRCGRTPESDTATVSAVVDGMQLTVTFLAGPWADDYFNKGEVVGLTGDNAGVRVKIEKWTGAGVVKLFGFLPATPVIGDTFTLIRGCGKTRADCMERNNMINFRGEPDSPGSDQLHRPTIPGQGND